MSLDRIKNLDKSQFAKVPNYSMKLDQSDIDAFEKVFGKCRIPRGGKSVEFILKTPIAGQLYGNVYRAFKYPDGYRVRTLAYAPSLAIIIQRNVIGNITEPIEAVDYEMMTEREVMSQPAMVTYRGYFLNFESPEEIKEFLEDRLLSQDLKAIEKTKKAISK